MAGKYLLDTNILIALFAADAAVQEKLGQAEEVLIPSVVFGELYFGAMKSGRVEANVQRVDDLLADSVVLDCTAETAKWYAVIKNALKLRGKPIPENDIWIAAFAMQHAIPLATRDAHFKEVEDLQVETW